MNDETECLIYNLVINIFINYKYLYMICKQFDKNSFSLIPATSMPESGVVLAESGCSIVLPGFRAVEQISSISLAEKDWKVFSKSIP